MFTPLAYTVADCPAQCTKAVLDFQVHCSDVRLWALYSHAISLCVCVQVLNHEPNHASSVDLHPSMNLPCTSLPGMLFIVTPVPLTGCQWATNQPCFALDTSGRKYPHLLTVGWVLWAKNWNILSRNTRAKQKALGHSLHPSLFKCSVHNNTLVCFMWQLCWERPVFFF